MTRKTVKRSFLFMITLSLSIFGYFFLAQNYERLTTPQMKVTLIESEENDYQIFQGWEYLNNLEKGILSINQEIQDSYKKEGAPVLDAVIPPGNTSACRICSSGKGYRPIGTESKTICIKTEDENLHRSVESMYQQYPIMSFLGYEYALRYPICIDIRYRDYGEADIGGETGLSNTYPNYNFYVTDEYKTAEIERSILLMAHEMSHIVDLQSRGKPTDFDSCIQGETEARTAESMVLVTLDSESIKSVFERLRKDTIYKSVVINEFETILAAWQRCSDPLKDHCFYNTLEDLYIHRLSDDEYYTHDCLRFQK